MRKADKRRNLNKQCDVLGIWISFTVFVMSYLGGVGLQSLLLLDCVSSTSLPLLSRGRRGLGFLRISTYELVLQQPWEVRIFCLFHKQETWASVILSDLSKVPVTHKSQSSDLSQAHGVWVWGALHRSHRLRLRQDLLQEQIGEK